MNQTIVKVDFHPFSPHHVIVLFKTGGLLIIDLIQISYHKIPISLQHSFVSFTFGPHIDWMAISIFLLKSNGEIFVVCPVMPKGAILPYENVRITKFLFPRLFSMNGFV
jgi:hypothetical protein